MSHTRARVVPPPLTPTAVMVAAASPKIERSNTLAEQSAQCTRPQHRHYKPTAWAVSIAYNNMGVPRAQATYMVAPPREQSEAALTNTACRCFVIRDPRRSLPVPTRAQVGPTHHNRCRKLQHAEPLSPQVHHRVLEKRLCPVEVGRDGHAIANRHEATGWGNWTVRLVTAN